VPSVTCRPLIGAFLLFVLSSGASAASNSYISQTAKVSISRIDVHSPVRLTQTEHKAFIASLHRGGWRFFQEQTLKFTQGAAEELAKEAYQDKGYFMAQVFSEVLVERGPNSSANVLVLHVTPGKRYRLAGISWHGTSAFSEAELASLMPIRRGEFFSRKKFARGLEAATKLYYSHGYINYTPIPQPQVDEPMGTLGFVIEVDEGGLFRFGELSVEGLQDAHRKLLLSTWEHLRGQPYNRHQADAFFNRFFKSPSPYIQPEDYVSFKIDENSHSVNYSLRLMPSLRYRVSKRLELELLPHP
jgi:outer membrane protein assembly factor BamA